MRGDTHAGCGERSGETGPWQHRHRAPDRLNTRSFSRSIWAMAVGQRTERFQFSSPSRDPRADATAGAPGARPSMRPLNIGTNS